MDPPENAKNTVLKREIYQQRSTIGDFYGNCAIDQTFNIFKDPNL